MWRRAGLVVLLLALAGLAACAQQQATGPVSGGSAEEASRINARLGASYLQAGDLREANEKLQRALTQDDSNSDAHAAFAILQMRLDRPDEAEHHFERALALDPDNPDIKNNFAAMLCSRGEHARGIDLFLEAAEDRLYQTPARAYANAGACARDAGRTDDARRYLRRALDAEPRYRRPLLELAELEFERERPDPAADYLQRFHEGGRQSASSLWLGVRIERMRGDAQAADRFGRSLVRHFPDSDQADEFLDTRN
jgi:type IV pilus assembly protein PilF